MKNNWAEVQATAKRAGFRNYEDYLFSDHWKQLRYSKLSETSRCCVCSSTGPLATHHIHYRNLLDVALADLAVICMDHHDIFHMACRQTGVDYIGLKIPEIIATTLAFQDTEWCKRWLEKKHLRRLAKAKPKSKHPNKAIRKQIMKKFRSFMGYPNRATAEEFCAWLLSQVRF